MSLIRVDYAGPGGTCEGMRMLGLEPVGIEWDAAACATRAAAGHLTIRADLATYRPNHAPGSVWGYWASPPCQTFSTAGKGDGRYEIDRLGTSILAEAWGDADLFDDKTRHVLDAARTACTIGAEWIGMEQVPAVLPLWRALTHVLERHGYSTWTGVLCAADYGVPQTRDRAVLLASRARCVQPPPATHAEHPGMLGELPWVSWGEALGVDDCMVIRPARGAGMIERHGERPDHPASRPAPTIISKARSWTLRTNQRPGGSADYARRSGLRRKLLGPDGESVPLNVAQALTLQSFRSDYPVAGSRSRQFEQVANAVPPLLSAHLVSALSGVPLAHALEPAS